MQIVEITTVPKTVDTTLAEYEASYLCPREQATDEHLAQFIGKMRKDGHYTTAQGALAEAIIRLFKDKTQLEVS